MTATGSRAAPRWSSMRAADSKSSPGWSRAKLKPKRGRPPDLDRKAQAETQDGSNDRTVRILFITDAWHPQINGVVRTLSTTGQELEKLGHDVGFIGPDQFRTMPLPGYSEIRIALKPG